MANDKYCYVPKINGIYKKSATLVNCHFSLGACLGTKVRGGCIRRLLECKFIIALSNKPVMYMTKKRDFETSFTFNSIYDYEYNFGIQEEYSDKIKIEKLRINIVNAFEHKKHVKAYKLIKKFNLLYNEFLDSLISDRCN